VENLWQILYYSAIAGLATTLGALLILLLGQPEEKLLASLLAGACGVMTAVVAADLLPAAWESGSVWQMTAGMLSGLLFMYLANQRLQLYQPPVSLSCNRRQQFKRMGLLVAAGIALHDFPEGMAIAIGQESRAELGSIITLAISLHNLPEGMVIAAPLLMANIRRWKIVVLTLGLAVFTPLGALSGLGALRLVHSSLAFFLALAAGAMSYLVYAELWPLSRRLQPRYALLSGFIGFALFAAMSLFLA
jgi:ZIP family zinc transporter